jgi:DNA polymerase-3 subunit gamma/tau
LYRKWRSQTFAELVGQEHVVHTLRQAIRTDRIGHAYLFTGPRGVGKTTMARLLAKAVNCLSPQEERPCDHCSMCRAISEGRAVDVIEMDAASHTSVDDAREIIERVQFRPTLARTKVYVIDEVHMLSTAAFNALLKTLEEPPGHALFILATTEVHKIPETIASRCQRFTFTRHSVANIAGHLEHIAHEEGVTLEAGVADRIARAATGSMRDAISILDQLMAGSGDTLTLHQTQDLLGATDSSNVAALMDALLNADLQSALQVVNAVADEGADLRQFARDLVEWLRSLLHVSAGNDAQHLDLPLETVQMLREQSERTNIAQLVAWLKLFSGLDFQLKNSPYGQLPLELNVVEALIAPHAPAAAPVAIPAVRPTTVARSAQPPAAQPTAQAATRPAGPPVDLPKTNGYAPQPAVQAAPMPEAPPREAQTEEETEQHVPTTTPLAPPVAPQEVIEVVDNAAFPLEDVQAVWPQVVEDILAKSRVLYANLQGVEPINVEENTVVLLAKQGHWQQQRLESEKNRRMIERQLTLALGQPCTFRVTADQHEEMPDAHKQLQHMYKDELVSSAIRVFDARIAAIIQPETDN